MMLLLLLLLLLLQVTFVANIAALISSHLLVFLVHVSLFPVLLLLADEDRITG